MYSVILYGCGKRCEKLLSCLPDDGIKIIKVADGNPSKWGSSVHGYEICNPRVLSAYQKVDICITIGNEKDKAEARDIIRAYNENILKNEIDYTVLIIKIYAEYYKSHKKSVEIKNRHSVLFDCHNGLGLGGIEEWTKSICQEFMKKNYPDIYIISPPGKYLIPQLLADRILYVDIDDGNKIGKKTIESVVACIEQRMPCTVVTCHIDEVLIAAGALKSIYPQHIKLVSVIHGGYEDNYIRYSELDELTDVYIGVSRDIQEALINRGIEAEKVLHITCPVNCDKKLMRQYTMNSHEPLKLGYAGRIELPQKRMDLLLKVVDSLEKKRADYKLILAGEGSALTDIQAFAKERGLDNRIICLGKIDRSKIPDFWKAIDVCVNIADVEGRSISIMEAMANGAVPVVTATSGVREDITDGENGYIVGIGDYEGMADKIYELCRHRDRLKTFGYKSHDMIYSKSQMDSHIDFWQRLFSSLWK